MRKSPPLNNYEEYRAWMLAQEFWTNPNYKQPDWERPKTFPMIVVGYMDYSCRPTAVTKEITLDDFEIDRVEEEDLEQYREELASDPPTFRWSKDLYRARKAAREFTTGEPYED